MEKMDLVTLVIRSRDRIGPLPKASGNVVYTGRERLLPNQNQARQEPRPPIRITGR